MSFWKNLFLPPRCAGCGELQRVLPGEAVPALCAACTERFEKLLRHQCPECHADYPECRCPQPLMKQFGIDVHIKLLPYGQKPEMKLTRHLIAELKLHRRPRSFAFLAEKLAPELLKELAKEGIAKEDCRLTYLPRAKFSVARYGLDQAKELANALSKESGVPCAELLYRRQDRRKQKRLTAKERFFNLQNAFSLKNQPECACVILVDDLATTGAGMAAGADLLRKAGVKKVLALSAAQTLKESKKKE